MYVLQFSSFRSLIFGTLLTKLHSHSILERISLFIFIFLLIMRIISQKPPFFNTLRFISLFSDTNIKENKKIWTDKSIHIFRFLNLTIFNTLKEFDENLSWWAGMDSNHRTLSRPDLQSGAINHSTTYPLWCALKDSNLGPTGYEPVALTSWAKGAYLNRKSYYNGLIIFCQYFF